MSNPTAPPALTVSAVIGRNIRRLRAERGLRQDDVAARARDSDLDWTQATVAAIEAGTRSIRLDDEFVLLPRVLSCSVADLLDGDAGERIMLARRDMTETGTDLGSIRDQLAGKLRYRVKHEVRPEVVTAWRRDARGAAELKAARKLGVGPLAVASTAHRLWGRSLTEERDARVADLADPAKNVQAVRGHVSRRLLAAMAEALKEGEG